MVATDKYLRQMESGGQWSSLQQSLDDFDHVKVWELNLLPQIQQAPQF